MLFYLQVATFFAVMKDTDWAQKKTFVTNFWHDWSKLLGKKHVIQKIVLCDFTPIYEWALQEKEKKKNMTSEVGVPKSLYTWVSSSYSCLQLDSAWPKQGGALL